MYSKKDSNTIYKPCKEINWMTKKIQKLFTRDENGKVDKKKTSS